MAIAFLDSLNLNKAELQNARIQNLATAPTLPVAGQVYFDTTDGALKYYDGAAWVVTDATQLANAVPLSALANIATGTLLGNNAGAAGSPLALTATQAKALLAIASGDVAGLTAAIEAIRLDQMAAPTAAVALNGQKITGLADPTAAQDAATKTYVDAQAQEGAAGLDVKDAVQAASIANLTLSGTQTVDGVALAAGDRVLVKNQTTASGNGIYAVAAGAWTRTTDADQGHLTSGALVLVLGGTTNAGTQWYLQTADPVTVGTTSLTFTQFGAGGTYTADASGGLQLTGSAFAVKLPASSGLTKGASGLQIDTTLIARKFSALVGDGAATAIVVTHNLGTQDVQVSLHAAASPFDIQYASVECTTVNTVTLRFATAPATGALRATVIG